MRNKFVKKKKHLLPRKQHFCQAISQVGSTLLTLNSYISGNNNIKVVTAESDGR